MVTGSFFVLKAINITKQIDHRIIIKGLSLSVKPGEKVTLMAPSGYGKTTLMGILGGIDRNFSGTVETSALKRGVVFQEPGLFSHKTVRENIEYPLRIKKIPWCSKTENLFQEWMDVTSLKGFEDYYPHEISRGMKQKSAIVRTFLFDPDLLFMDEPFSSIDKESANRIIAHINANYPDLTLVVASHSLGLAEAFSDRILTAEESPIACFKIIKPDGLAHGIGLIS